MILFMRKVKLNAGRWVGKRETRSVQWLALTQNKTSCLTTAFLKIPSSVFGRVSPVILSSLVFSGSYMPRCKETLLQVKQRLTREQRNRTVRRVRELLDFEERDSDSDSGEEENNSIDENSDSLSLIRRDLYLGLLFLLLLIVLQTYWFRSTCLRK